MPKHKPWEKTTGPKTAEGKAKSAANGWKKRQDDRSAGQVAAALAEAQSLVRRIAELWRLIGG